MISPLGPRGDVGVSNTLRAPDLQNLPILVDYAKRYGPCCNRSHADGTKWVDSSKRLHGRKTENKRRAAARRAAK